MDFRGESFSQIDWLEFIKLADNMMMRPIKRKESPSNSNSDSQSEPALSDYDPWNAGEYIIEEIVPPPHHLNALEDTFNESGDQPMEISTSQQLNNNATRRDARYLLNAGRFSGTRQDGELGRQWLNRYESEANKCNWSQECLSSNLVLHLDGPALEWYCRHIDQGSQIMPWCEVKHNFLMRFEPSKRVKWFLRNMWDPSVETLQTFYDKMISIGRSNNFDEDLIVWIMTTALPEEYSNCFLDLIHCDSCSKWLDMVVEATRNLRGIRALPADHQADHHDQLEHLHKRRRFQ